MAAFQVMMILMVDINPGNAAAATAANNLFRCLLGAGSTAVVVPMIDRMGVGWTYTFSSLVWIAFSPLLWALMKYGPKWRKEKKTKEDAEEKEAKDKAEAETHSKIAGLLVAPEEARNGEEMIETKKEVLEKPSEKQQECQ